MENDAKESGAAKTRHPGLERFNKRTGRGLAGALLLGALIFQAPWKVTLIAAFAFASSVGLIPNPIMNASKWIVRGALIAWPVWVFLPSDPGGYKPFTFVEEQAQFEEEYGVPADQNACAAYMRLLEESEPNDRHLPSWMGESDKAVLRRPWSSQEHPEIARWLDERESIIEALKSLSQYSQCRFPTEPMLPTSDSADERIEAVKAWAHVLAAAASRKAGEGDIAGALQIYALISKIANHHIQQYDVRDYLVGLAVEKMVFDGITGMAVDGSPAPDELAIMDALVATPSHEWASTWRRIMSFGCLSVKNTFCRAVYEIDAKGRIRYSRSSYVDYQGIKSPYQRSFNGKRLASGMWLVLPKSPWKFARCIDERYEQFSQIGQPGIDPEFQGTKHHSRFRANHEYVLDRLTDILEPAYYKVHGIHTKSVAARQACRIILLLRQYKDETGRWPESLDEVAGKGDSKLWTDPLSGGPFVYKPEGQAFRLYSGGKDGVDEDGTGGDDFSFWPTQRKKAERERASPEPE